MRKNYIGFLRILTLLFIFTLCGCSEEIYENELKTNPKFKVEIVNSNALTKNKELMKSLSINKVIRPSQTSRIIRDTINGFSIDTDNVKYLEGSDFNSYTFNILNQESEEMDNLVLMSQPNGSYKPYIMRYDLTTAEKEALNEGKNIDFTNKTKVIILHDSNLVSDIFSRISYMEVCTMTYTWEEQVTIIPCEKDYCLIEPWASYTVSYVLVGTSTCSGGGGGGGSIVDSGDSGGYIGTAPHGGGGGSPPPVVPPSPCDKLKNQKTKLPTLQTELAGLALKTSEQTELGLFKTSSANVIQSPASTNTGTVIFPPLPSLRTKYTMMAHTHNSPASSTYSVFSWSDLVALANSIRQGNVDTDNFTAYLATADGTYYALTIENPAAFSQFFATILDSDFDASINAIMDREMNKYYNPYFFYGDSLIKENSTDNVKDEKAFLDLLQNNNLGVTLFESNKDFTTFSEVSHNTNTDNIDKKPCN